MIESYKSNCVLKWLDTKVSVWRHKYWNTSDLIFYLLYDLRNLFIRGNFWVSIIWYDKFLHELKKCLSRLFPMSNIMKWYLKFIINFKIWYCAMKSKSILISGS